MKHKLYRQLGTIASYAGIVLFMICRNEAKAKYGSVSTNIWEMGISTVTSDSI